MTLSSKALRNSLLYATILMMVAPMLQAQTPAQDEYLERQQHQVDDLEDLRSTLSELLDTVHEYSDLVLPYDLELAASLNAAQVELEQFSQERLTLFRAVLNPDDINLQLARDALTESRPLFEAVYQAPGSLPTGFQGWEAPTTICDALIGSGRPSEALITGANMTYDLAVGIMTETSSVCDQVAAAQFGGEGVSTSTACAVSENIFLAAQAVRDKITSCSALYTARKADVNALDTVMAAAKADGSMLPEGGVRHVRSPRVLSAGRAQTRVHPLQ